MNKHRLLAVAIAITLGVVWVSSDLWAAKKPNSPGEIPMTATFRDLEGDGIESDKGGDYVNGVDGVRAVLVSIRNFVLDTRNSPRFFSLDFTGTACVQAVGLSVVAADFFSTGRLIDDGGNLVDGRLLGMPVGAMFSSVAQANFAVGDTGYFLRFDPADGGEYVQVTRGPEAHQWVIEAGPRVAAALLSHSLTGRPVTTHVATCEMPFRLDVVCQKAGDCPAP